MDLMSPTDFIEYLQCNFDSFWPIQTQNGIEYHDYFLNTKYTCENVDNFSTFKYNGVINENFTPILHLVAHTENIFSETENKLLVADRFKLYSKVDLKLFQTSRQDIITFLFGKYEQELSIEQYIKIPKLTCMDFTELPTFDKLDDMVTYIEHVYNDDPDYYKYFTFNKNVPRKFVKYTCLELEIADTLKMLEYADATNITKSAKYFEFYNNIMSGESTLQLQSRFTILPNTNTGWGVPYNV